MRCMRNQTDTGRNMRWDLSVMSIRNEEVAKGEGELWVLRRPSPQKSFTRRSFRGEGAEGKA